MEMTLGETGLDWGSIAEWIAIAVNLILGASVFVLGHRTHQLTEQATARDSKAQSDQDTQQLREGRLLLVLFRPEVGLFRMRLEEAAKFVTPGEALDEFSKAVDPAFIGIVNGLALTSIFSKQHRLHILPDAQAVALVGIAGNILPLREMMNIVVAQEGDVRKKAGAKFHEELVSMIRRAKNVEEFCEAAKHSFKAEKR
ncbi:hypothetical protein [Lysobacter enzymogenes]|uniref:hypothetical protein n=1 Tax=Lysobacter enzymogenes TaxID=69 RepID=UPI0019D1881B|nr:hypothetical protein [Lysobacter enzymogenes]